MLNGRSIILVEDKSFNWLKLKELNPEGKKFIVEFGKGLQNSMDQIYQ